MSRTHKRSVETVDLQGEIQFELERLSDVPMIDAEERTDLHVPMDRGRALLPAATEERGEEILQVVGFNLGEEEYAVDIHDVVGVERLDNVVRLPKMPAFIEGVMTIRDESVALIKLRTRFSLAERDNDEQTRVVVIESDEQTLGYIVDSVTSVHRIPHTDVEAVPPIALTIDSRFVTGLVRTEEMSLIILDPRSILFEHESTQLGSALEVDQAGSGTEE